MTTKKDEFYNACRAGKVPEVKAFLEECPFDVYYLNYCLRWSSFEGHKEVCELLVDNGADPRFEKDSPFCMAAMNGKYDLLQYFIDFGADIHALDDYALRMASKNGYLEVVKVLLENGANARADNDYAIRYAAVYGHYEIVKVLLENGARITLDALWRVYDKAESDPNYRRIEMLLFESFKD